MPGSPKWSLSLSYRHQNPLYFLPISFPSICSPQQFTSHTIKLLELYRQRLNKRTIRKNCCVPPYSRVQNCVSKALCCP